MIHDCRARARPPSVARASATATPSSRGGRLLRLLYYDFTLLQSTISTLTASTAFAHVPAGIPQPREPRPRRRPRRGEGDYSTRLSTTTSTMQSRNTSTTTTDITSTSFAAFARGCADVQPQPGPLRRRLLRLWRLTWRERERLLRQQLQRLPLLQGTTTTHTTTSFHTCARRCPAAAARASAMVTPSSRRGRDYCYYYSTTLIQRPLTEYNLPQKLLLRILQRSHMCLQTPRRSHGLSHSQSLAEERETTEANTTTHTTTSTTSGYGYHTCYNQLSHMRPQTPCRSKGRGHGDTLVHQRVGARGHYDRWREPGAAGDVGWRETENCGTLGRREIWVGGRQRIGGKRVDAT